VGVLLLVLFGQALRAVLRHKGRTALTTLGIAIAVAAVAWVVALGHESAARYADLLAGLGDNLVWVEAGARTAAGVRTGSKTANTLTLGDMEAIKREVPSITRISPQVDGTVSLVSERSNWTTRSRGVSPDYLAIKRYAVASGALFTNEDVASAKSVIVLGETVKKQLFGPEDPIGQLVRVNGLPHEVIAVLAPKGQSASGTDQDDAVWVPYTTALKKQRAPGIVWVDDIVCSAADPGSVKPAAQQITALMRERHHILADAVSGTMNDDFNIRHPEEIVNAQLEASRTFSSLLIAVASVALLVGGIGIMNVMLASVTERTREIGLRVALGAKPAAILLQFLTEAILVSALGGAFGVLLSVLGASAIGRALGWTLTIPIDAMLLAIVVSAATGIVFGLLPARGASRLDPIEALRSE
jgi:putative ABC transport system permease protein